MPKKYQQIAILLATCLLSLATKANDPNYFICGPDEDGCPQGQEQYCSCIPYDTVNAAQPYCQDYEARNCKPLSQAPNCYQSFIYPSQGECLASLFQSEPQPPCGVVKKSFCEHRHSYMCGADGHPENCRPAS